MTANAGAHTRRPRPSGRGKASGWSGWLDGGAPGLSYHDLCAAGWTQAVVNRRRLIQATNDRFVAGRTKDAELLQPAVDEVPVQKGLESDDWNEHADERQRRYPYARHPPEPEDAERQGEQQDGRDRDEQPYPRAEALGTSSEVSAGKHRPPSSAGAHPRMARESASAPFASRCGGWLGPDTSSVTVRRGMMHLKPRESAYSISGVT